MFNIILVIALGQIFITQRCSFPSLSVVAVYFSFVIADEHRSFNDPLTVFDGSTTTEVLPSDNSIFLRKRQTFVSGAGITPQGTTVKPSLPPLSHYFLRKINRLNFKN